jgi:hypothetical protein
LRPLIASRRITTKLGEASFKAPTFAASDGVSLGVGFMHMVDGAPVITERAVVSWLMSIPRSASNIFNVA